MVFETNDFGMIIIIIDGYKYTVTNMQLCETGMAQPIPVGALASALPV